MMLFLFALIAYAFADSDVAVLTTDSFDSFLASNEFVLVEFFAPWCGHCKKLEPEYVKAAADLKQAGSPVRLATVDATIESSLAEQHGVKGYPTLKFFRSGSPVETAKDIVNWVSKKSGPPSKTLASQADIDAVVASSGTRALAYVSGDNTATWLNIAKNEKVQAFSFAHVADSALFGGKKEGTVELHKDGEDVKTYDGELNVDDVATWILSEGFPLVDELAQESWTRAQSSGLDLLAIFSNDGDANAATVALEVAKANKGTLVVTTSSQVAIASRWGSSGNVVPTAIYASFQSGAPGFVIWNEDVNADFNVDNVKAFVAGARDGSYDSYIKSEPIPEPNDAPVTVLVGKNFDDIVNAKKDVLVEFYAPWCGHCQKLAPIYDELGLAYKDDDNVVIAKMDATANGVPKGVAIQGFPTILFFDAEGNKHDYNGERELAAFQSWIEANRVTKASSGEKEDL